MEADWVRDLVSYLSERLGEGSHDRHVTWLGQGEV